MINLPNDVLTFSAGTGICNLVNLTKNYVNNGNRLYSNNIISDITGELIYSIDFTGINKARITNISDASTVNIYR